MTHQVLSRKYRPQRFDECVGQEHVARIFKNALASDRTGHAYLLVGPRGVGKTTTARIVARALNCERLADPTALEADAIEPCGECASCRDIAAGSDLDVVEMDAASNNAVDDVRALREQVGYATVRSRYRIWIVDEVHMLSLPAFNAFLKTLEEPPPQVKFLFCTTEEHKLPDTFRSRCQRVEFRPIDAGTMAERLVALAAEEDVAIEDGVALAIAEGALGGLRDAESQLEQLIAARASDDPIQQADLDALSGRASAQLLDGLLAAIDARDAGQALDAVDACLVAGCKPGVLVDQWLEALRARMVDAVRAGGGYAKSARGIEILLGKRAHVRAGADGALVAQVAAIELARLPDARDLDALVEALQGAGGHAPPDPARGPAAAPPRAAQAPRPAPTPAAAPAPGRSTAGSPVAGGPAATAPGAGTPAGRAPAGLRADAVPPEAMPPEAMPAAPRAPAPARGPERAPPRARAASTSQGPPVFRTRAPEPEPEGDGVLALEAVAASWSDITARGATRSPVLGRVLAVVRPVVLENDTLFLEVPPRESELEGAAEARGTLRRREVGLAFAQISKDVLGTALKLEIYDAASLPTVAKAAAHELRDHPTVQMVTERTGGRLLNVERDSAAEGGGDRPPEAGGHHGA